MIGSPLLNTLLTVADTATQVGRDSDGKTYTLRDTEILLHWWINKLIYEQKLGNLHTTETAKGPEGWLPPTLQVKPYPHSANNQC